MAKYLAKLILFSLSVVIGIFLFELALRLFYPHPFGFVQGAVIPDSELCYALAANFSAMVRTLDEPYNTYFSTNSFGARITGPFIPAAPTVLMLGDSFTMALQVNNEETFSSIVQKQTGMNVLNFGVLGYNPYHYLVLLNRTLEKFNTKFVIVNFYISNDFVLPAVDPGKGCQTIAANGYLVANKTSLFFSARMWLHHNSHAFNFLLEILNRSDWLKMMFYKIEIAATPPDAPEALLFDDGEEQYNNTFAVLDEINKITKAHNATLVLAAIPASYHIDEKQWNAFWQRYGSSVPDREKPYKKFAEFAASRNITLIDMRAVLQKEYFGKRDNHYNAKGHKVHAEKLAEILG